MAIGGVQPRMRTVISGHPRTGKTHLSQGYHGIVRHTDDLIQLGWSRVSEEVSRWLSQPYDLIEGVAAIRGLRKWLDLHPTGKPCDRLVWLTRPHCPLTPGQHSMAQGCETIFAGIAPTLRARGVVIDQR